jgi:hypothetical protein
LWPISDYLLATTCAQPAKADVAIFRRATTRIA